MNILHLVVDIIGFIILSQFVIVICILLTGIIMVGIDEITRRITK